jgi:uncharacterized lipoprotein YajG
MRSTHLWKLAVPLLCATLAGCATSRSEIALTAPAAPTVEPKTTARGTVVIRSVKDERIFEQSPRDPSIPSLGFEGASQATADVKLRAVGRKRNTYGQALGDILLQPGRTVEDVIRENLGAAFERAGYRVTQQTTSDAPTLVVDVRITRFWAWMRPGFWALTLNTDISTALDVSGATPGTTITVHAEDSRQFADDEAWIAVIKKALDAYREEAAQRIDQLPR